MYDEGPTEHFRPLGWRDMPMEDQDHREMVEREAKADAREAAKEPHWSDRRKDVN